MKDTKDTKDTIAIRFAISRELHKELKVLAAQDDTTLQKLLPVLISAGMARHAHNAQMTQKSGVVQKVAKSTKPNKDTKNLALVSTTLDK